MAVTVRTLSKTVTFASVTLTDVISARGKVTADGGWPTCSVFLTAKPGTGNEEDTLTVTAGAGNNVIRFTGRVRRFRASSFPRGVEMVATGTLAYAAEWSPSEDIVFEDEFPSGATDQVIVRWVLDHVPGITYSSGDIAGTGVTLGDLIGPPRSGGGEPSAFDWKKGTSAWAQIQALDQATLYRTYQQRDGTIARVQMIGHPHDGTEDFELLDEDVLEGSTGTRDTERTRNAVIVEGHDYGDGFGPVLGFASGSNGFQGDGSDPDTRYAEKFSSDMIEDGNDEDMTTPLNMAGINAQDIADLIIHDVNKEFVEADVHSWHDDTHGPGLTCLLNVLDQSSNLRLLIGEDMWVRDYSWEISDGWTATYGLTGGGIYTPTYTPPDS